MIKIYKNITLIIIYFVFPINNTNKKSNINFLCYFFIFITRLFNNPYNDFFPNQIRFEYIETILIL